MALKKFQFVGMLCVAAFFFVSCGKDDPSVNAARLRISLTDATSFVIKELYIDIQRIEVYTAGATDAEKEWTALEFSGGEYNVLTLTNGKTKQIVNQFFPANKTIEKIKLVLGPNSRLVTRTDETKPFETKPLNIPPGLKDGIIIENVNANLYANIICNIVIDINAAFSIRETNGNFFFNPVIRAFPETFGGSFRGYVSKVLDASVFVGVIKDTDTFFTQPEPDGMFMFTGLKEGDWEVHVFTIPDTNFRDTVFSDTITQGKIREIKPKPIVLKPKQTGE